MKIVEGNIASPLGFSADGLHAGFKRRKMDFGWIVSECPASAAGVYTTNQVIAAPLMVTKEALAKEEKLQAIVVNSGVANACTGQQGLEDARTMQAMAAEKLGFAPELVAVASTGVIGEPLPMDRLAEGLSKIYVNGNADDFAQAILTTDTVTKTVVVKDMLGKDEVTMAGVAKGSGMIHPNMATMLAFITCDANISSALLQDVLSEQVETTFNQITVDGDTSTNDMVLVLSNGCTQNPEIQPDSPELEQFKRMLALVMTDLAQKIARDGEGATKLIEVAVQGAANSEAARMIAKTIVGSSLVKTAMFGEDPNWGRLMSAVGNAGVSLETANIDIDLAGVPVLRASSPLAFDEEDMRERLSQDTICVTVRLHQGSASGKAWGCDLSYDYVKINALYRT